MSDFSRRKFLKTGAAALAGITIAPSSILGMSHGHVSPTDKLNLAAVGIGGMGHANINNVKGTENIVALCDVDWKYAKGVFDEFPNAKKYWDYRKMYDEMGKSIDGVIIATADHTHAIITADAMTMGKHVYCQKPLTHSVYESRLLTKLAASTGVVTQMGNQGASGEGTDIKLGSFHRTCQTEPVQQRLSSLELARMVGLRYRCTGRYGLPYSASAVQSSETGLSYQGGRFFYIITECLRSSGPAREDDFPRPRQYAESCLAGS